MYRAKRRVKKNAATASGLYSTNCPYRLLPQNKLHDCLKLLILRPAVQPHIVMEKAETLNT